MDEASEKRASKIILSDKFRNRAAFFFKSFHPWALTLFSWMAETALYSVPISIALIPPQSLPPFHTKNILFLRKSTEMVFIDCPSATACTVRPTRHDNVDHIPELIIKILVLFLCFSLSEPFANTIPKIHGTYLISIFPMHSSKVLEKETKSVRFDIVRTASKIQMPPL